MLHERLCLLLCLSLGLFQNGSLFGERPRLAPHVRQLNSDPREILVCDLRRGRGRCGGRGGGEGNPFVRFRRENGRNPVYFAEDGEEEFVGLASVEASRFAKFLQFQHSLIQHTLWRTSWGKKPLFCPKKLSYPNVRRMKSTQPTLYTQFFNKRPQFL